MKHITKKRNPNLHYYLMSAEDIYKNILASIKDEKALYDECSNGEFPLEVYSSTPEYAFIAVVRMVEMMMMDGGLYCDIKITKTVSLEESKRYIYDLTVGWCENDENDG